MVQRCRLVEWADSQLAVEDANAVAVLLQSGGTIAARRVGPDQLTMRGLMKSVEGEAASCSRDRLWVLAPDYEHIDETVEHGCDLPAQLIAGQPLPVVELDGVAKPEPGEEWTAVEGNGGAEWVDAAVARLCHPVAVRRALGRQPAQLGDVEDNPVHVEREKIAVGLEPAAAERRPERRECASQCGPRPLGVGLRPEQRRHCVAPHRATGDGEVGEESRGFARVHVKWASVNLHYGWTEQRD